MNRVPTTLYLWISRAAGFVGIAFVFVAFITRVTDMRAMASPATYVQLAIAAFLVAIWAVLYELRDQGIKTK